MQKYSNMILHHTINKTIYDDPIYLNDINETYITFEYFDNKPFKAIENSYFHTINYHNLRYYCFINIKPFSRLLKIKKLINIDDENLRDIFYYIEHCESIKFKFYILEYIKEI